MITEVAPRPKFKILSLMQRNLFALNHCVGYFVKKTITQEQTSKLISSANLLVSQQIPHISFEARTCCRRCKQRLSCRPVRFNDS